MGIGFTQSEIAATGSDGDEQKGNGGLGPGEESQIPHGESGVPESKPAKVAEERISSFEIGSAMGFPVQKSSRKILIVDDETAIADTLSLIFQMKRYEVRVAYTAERAIEVIAEWTPELAVLDVMLPAMNGIDLALVIKANHPKCHVILFSGHANTGELLEEAGRKGHRFEILAKPVQPEVMLERVSALLSGADEAVYN